MSERKSDKAALAPADSSSASASRPWLVPHSWRPGQSGNPGGKSLAVEEAKANIKRLCAEKSEYALGKVVGLLESRDDRVVLMAAKEILAWGFGTPNKQTDEEAANGNVTINILKYGEQPPQIINAGSRA